MSMKEGRPVYGKKHERKAWGRLGRKRWRGNLLKKRRRELDGGS
jgi:hypothetical protein